MQNDCFAGNLKSLNEFLK